MCVLDNTAQGLGQGKKPAHLEDSWQGAWSMEKEARREVGRDERSGIICRKEIFDRKPYIVPNRVMVKCELRDVIHTPLPPIFPCPHWLQLGVSGGFLFHPSMPLTFRHICSKWSVM
jgi:hypothetical protein